jgi:hypothetical protein
MAVEQLLPPPVAGARSVDPTMSVNSTVASSRWGPGNLELQVSTTTSRTPREKSMLSRSAAWSKSEVF